MSHRLTKASIQTEGVANDQDNASKDNSQIQTQLLIAENASDFSEQDQIITAEVDTKQCHEYGGNILQIRRITGHGVILDAETAGTGGAQGMDGGVVGIHPGDHQQQKLGKTERNYSKPVKSPYLFRVKPSAGVREGEIRVTDSFGNTYTEKVAW